MQLLEILGSLEYAVRLTKGLPKADTKETQLDAKLD